MAKKLVLVFGIVFVLVGVLGMVGTGIVGPMGAFETNTLHDLVHLIVGIVLLVVAFMAPSQSAMWLKIFGVVYLLVAVLGYLTVPAGGEILGLVHTNSADHILHIVLGIVLFAAGQFTGKSAAPMATPPMGGTMGGTM